MMPMNVVAAAGDIKFEMLTGEIGSRRGFIRSQSEGSLTPDIPVAGGLIETISTSDTVMLFRIEGANVPDADSTFIQIAMTGTFSNGSGTNILVRSAAANYDPNIIGPVTGWEWNPEVWRLLNNNTYDVVIT